MKIRFVPAAAAFAAGMLLAPSMAPQIPRPQPQQQEPDSDHLPNGKSRQDAILKEEHEKSIKDAAQLVDLAESLKRDLEKQDAHVLSLSILKQTEEIEKVARRIRSRMKRF